MSTGLVGYIFMASLTFHYDSCSTKLGSGDATTPLCNLKLIRSTLAMYYYLIPYALQNLYEEISPKNKVVDHIHSSLISILT